MNASGSWHTVTTLRIRQIGRYGKYDIQPNNGEPHFIDQDPWVIDGMSDKFTVGWDAEANTVPNQDAEVSYSYDLRDCRWNSTQHGFRQGENRCGGCERGDWTSGPFVCEREMRRERVCDAVWELRDALTG
jgi:hypothetical protein